MDKHNEIYIKTQGSLHTHNFIENYKQKVIKYPSKNIHFYEIPDIGVIGYTKTWRGSPKFYVDSELYYNKMGKWVSGFYRPNYYWRSSYCLSNVSKDAFDDYIRMYPRSLEKKCEDGKFVTYSDYIVDEPPDGIVAAYSIIDGDYCYLVRNFNLKFSGKYCLGCGKELRRNIYVDGSLEPYASFGFRNYCGQWCRGKCQHEKNIRVISSKHNSIHIIEYYNKDFTYEEAEQEAKKFHKDFSLDGFDNLVFIAKNNDLTVKIGDEQVINKCFDYVLNFGGSYWFG